MTKFLPRQYIYIYICDRFRDIVFKIELILDVFVLAFTTKYLKNCERPFPAYSLHPYNSEFLSDIKKTKLSIYYKE